MNHQGQRRGRHQPHWRVIADEVIRRLRQEAHADRLGRHRGHEQRVAVRHGLGHVLGADVAGRTETVVDQHLPAPGFGELLADNAADHVERPAGGERHHEADRFVRVGNGRRLGERGRGGE
jgi:hypothetical protein